MVPGAHARAEHERERVDHRGFFRVTLADQARDEVTLGLFGYLQLFELLDGHMKLNRFLHKRAQLVRLNGVKLDGKVDAKGFRASLPGPTGDSLDGLK